MSDDHTPASVGAPLAAPLAVPFVALTTALGADVPAHGLARPIARIPSDLLLAGGTEVHIEHRGAIYRLKQTALGKLILTK